MLAHELISTAPHLELWLGVYLSLTVVVLVPVHPGPGDERVDERADERCDDPDPNRNTSSEKPGHMVHQ